MFERNCPSCSKIILYKNKRKFLTACKNESECRSCCKTGSKNPMYGLLNENNPNFGQIRESISGENNPSKRPDVRKKISESKGNMSGENNPRYGKKHTDETKEKISLSNKGKKRKPETIEKIREARKKQLGEKCPGWKGGITPLVRLLRNSDEYSNWRKSIFERDDYTCRLCKSKGLALEAHHVIGVYEKIELIYDIENGLTMCKKCHLEFHNEHGRKNFPNIIELYKLFN